MSVRMDTILEAYQLLENNQAEKAIQLLKQYESKASDDEKFTIAQMYMQIGFLQEASTILHKLLQKYPTESEILITLAEIYIEIEEDEQAMELLNQVNEGDTAYTQALIQLADLYQAQGLFEVAEQKLLKAKQLEPNEEIIDFALGELYFSIGEYKKAILYYEKVKVEEVGNISLLSRLGEANAAIGEYEKALTYYQDNDQKDPDYLYRYGIIAYQADRVDIAIKAWEKVVELDPYYHTVYQHLAQAYEDEGRLDEAVHTAQKGLQFDEFNKELFFITAMVANKLNNTKEVETYLREAIALDPDYKQAVLSLVDHYKNLDEHEKIIDLLNEIKRTGAEDSLYDWELARANNEIESFDNALKHYNEAYNGLNQDSDFLKEYGYFLTEEGRIEQAIPVLKSYLSIVPLDAEMEEFLYRLKQTSEDDI